MIKNKLLHFGAALQFLVLMGFVVLFLFLLISGNISMYVSPQIEPFVWFGTAVMFVMAIANLRQVLKLPRSHTFLSPYIIFFIPLVLMLLFSPVTIMSRDLPGRTIDHTFTETGLEKEQDPASQSMAGQVDPEDEDIFMDLEFLGDFFQPEILDPEDEEIKVKLRDGIGMDSENYYKWYYNLYHEPEKFEGGEVKFKGFIYHDEELQAQGNSYFNSSKEGEFFWSARFLMVCCVADMILIGMPVQHTSPEEFELESDTWVKVEGSIETFSMDGNQFPIIRTDEITKTDQPEIPYVFPY